MNRLNYKTVSVILQVKLAFWCASMPPSCLPNYGPISQMTYLSQNVYLFCKDLVTGHCLYQVKHSISSHHPFSNWFYYPHFVDVKWNSCKTQFSPLAYWKLLRTIEVSIGYQTWRQKTKIKEMGKYPPEQIFVSAYIISHLCWKELTGVSRILRNISLKNT